MAIHLKYHLSSFIPVFSVATGSLVINSALGKDIDIKPSEIEVSLELLIMTILMIVVSSIVMVFIFKRLKGNKIRLFYGLILSIPIFEFSFEILYSNLPISSVLLISSTIILLLFTITFFVTYATGRPNIWIRNTGIILVSLIIGRQLAIFFSLNTIIMISLIFALYDIYSVFYGPLSKIIGKPKKFQFRIPEKDESRLFVQNVCSKGTPVFIAGRYSMLGIGDTLFFSLILLSLLQNHGYLLFGLAVSTIYFGSVLTLVILKRISPLPALPFPIFITMAVLIPIVI